MTTAIGLPKGVASKLEKAIAAVNNDTPLEVVQACPAGFDLSQAATFSVQWDDVVQAAALPRERRPGLDMVQVESFDDGSAQCAATDSYVLSVGRAVVESGAAAARGGVPASIVKAAGRHLSDMVDVHGDYTRFSVNGERYYCRHANVSMPNVNMLFPQSFEAEHTTTPKIILGALDMVPTIGKHDLALLVLDGGLSVRTVGTAPDGVEMVVGFNVSRMRQVLEGMAATCDVTVKLINPLRPVVLEQGGLRALVMPVRLSDAMMSQNHWPL